MNLIFQTEEKKYAQELNISAVIALAHIDYMLELNYPEYTGVRMNKKIRAKLVKLRKISELDDSSNNRSRFFLYKELADRMGDGKVYFGPTMPLFYSMPDIVFCANENGQALDLPEKFVKTLDHATSFVSPPNLNEMDPPNLNKMGYKWFALILVQWHHSNQAGEVFGIVRFKANLLIKLGYEVRIIQPKNLQRWTQQGQLMKSDITYITNAMNQDKYLQK